jgi:hypothetical protein
VPLQKNEEGHEQPIAFFSKSLRDDELKYYILEKHAYSLVKALKAFGVYVLQSSITVYVPSNSVKEIMVQPDNEGKRGKWIVKLLEYDLHINPTKLIKGKGLAKLLYSPCKLLLFTLVHIYYLLFVAPRMTTRFEEDKGQIPEIKSYKILYFKSEPILKVSC